MINVLNKSIEPFLRFSKKRSKSKIIMAVMLRKSLVLEIKKTQTNETFMASKYNYNTHFGFLWSNFIKIVFFFQSI